MAFMVPQYTSEKFVLMVKGHDEQLVPDTVKAMLLGDGFTISDTYSGSWFCRLSAPGYMDCTDWSGPYATLKQAKKAIEDLYDVDPETGEDLVA